MLSVTKLLIGVFVWLQQRWSLEALSSNSSWPSRTTARLCSNPWSKLLCFSAEMHFMCCMCKKITLAPLEKMPSHLSCSISQAVQCRVHSLGEKQSLSYCFKASVPFQHKTPAMQLSTSTDFLLASHHLLILLTTSISFPHSPLWLYQIAFISPQPWYSIWRPTSFCCVRAKCWIGISPQRAFRWHITYFSGHVGGPKPSSNTGCVIFWLIHLINFLCFDNVKPSSLLNVTVLLSAWDFHAY